MNQETGALYGIPARYVASLCGVSLRTAIRWKDAQRAPRWAARVISLLCEGDLGAVAPAWAGWRFQDGALVSPEGERYAQGEIRAIPYRREQLRELQKAATEPQQRRLL